jgi:hypothetical protein
MAQLSLRLIAFLAELALTEGSTDRYGKMTKMVSINAVSRPFGNEPRHDFRFYFVSQVDKGDASLRLA